MNKLIKGFCFVARQKRITIDGDHYYIDLVFYNYILKCFVNHSAKSTMQITGVCRFFFKLKQVSDSQRFYAVSQIVISRQLF